MISDVVLVGTLREKATRGFRWLEIISHDALKEKDFISRVLIYYWSRNENNRLAKYKDGSTLAIKGHLEVDEEYGLYIMIESIYLLKVS